jgi:hypothetical protein
VYVLVNEEVVGEYTLAQSKVLRGRLGLSLLPGTNKDYGTRCEMTNLHLWIPKTWTGSLDLLLFIMCFLCDYFII